MAVLAPLAAAAVDDDELTRIVARLLDTDPTSTTVRDVSVETVDYDIPAITTAARWWIRGTAEAASRDRRFTLFVKHVQSWSRSPMFAQVPPAFHDVAEQLVPWRTEVLIYRSDLANRLPAGLRMPRALAVRDLDTQSAALWLEAVDVVPCAWTSDDYREAGYLVGRLNANADVAELSAIDEAELRRSPRVYVDRRVAIAVAPMLRDDEIWRHPLIAGAFDARLRTDLRAALDALPRYLDELDRVALGAAHGDTCPNNLLRTAEPGFVLIDFGFWSTQPLGFDLAQLVLGDVQLGRTAVADIPRIEAACIDGYLDGLRAEGCSIDPATIRRAYLIKALIFTGLTALPVEDLDQPMTPGVQHHAHERAALARYLLDALAASDPR